MTTGNKEIITGAFSAKDRKHLWIPEHIATTESISDRKIITWTHKSGHLGYAIYNWNGHLSGIILKRAPLVASQGKSCMCDWCLSVYPASKIASFSLKKSRTSFVSYLLCSDLNCEQRILSPDTNNVHDMRETLSKKERITRYYANIEKYWKEQVTPL